MRGFLTALLLCVGAGILFAASQPASLLTDGPASVAVAEAKAAGPSTTMMR